MLIPHSRAAPPLHPTPQWDYPVHIPESSTFHFWDTTTNSKFKNCTILIAALCSKCLQRVCKEYHMDPKTCNARVEWIHLTITISWDVMPCSFVGRFQLSEESAIHILMAEKWICNIQDAVDWTKQLTSVFHKKWRIFGRAARLQVSQEGRSSMKWVSCFCNLHAWLHNLHPTNSKSENDDIIHTFHEGSLVEPKSFKFYFLWINQHVLFHFIVTMFLHQ